MELFLYWPARILIGAFQMLPLPWVAHIGRAFGALVYCFDARHRKKTIENLTFCFPEKNPQEIKSIAKESFRRIGESFCSAVKTASMDWEELKMRCETVGIEQLPQSQPGQKPQNCMVALGHFANFELWARMGKLVPGYQTATTYRGLRQNSLNKLLQALRTRSGCLFFERRTQGAALKAALAQSGIILGVLSDQHAGDNGLKLPFFGRLCSTSAAAAVFALRYRCPLHVGLCYRTAPGHWRLEISEAIPILDQKHEPRSPAEIMADVNKKFEDAVRRDPANWFWVHNRWKLKSTPAPEAVKATGDAKTTQLTTPAESAPQ